MNYELAKELKDAGFPQYGHNYDEGGNRCIVQGRFIEGNAKDGGTLEGTAYAPTLSELIEACGEDFKYLSKRDDGKWVGGNHSGKIVHGEYTEHSYQFGETPSEAVARLWLALNKK